MTLAGDKMPPPFVNVRRRMPDAPAWRWTGPYIGVNGGFNEVRVRILVAPSVLSGAALPISASEHYICT